MPVYRYRHVGEMEDRAWREPGDPELFVAIRAAWEFARRTTQPRFPPGVYKHASLEEADALRDAWEQSNFEAFRARRAKRETPPGGSEGAATGAQPLPTTSES